MVRRVPVSHLAPETLLIMYIHCSGNKSSREFLRDPTLVPRSYALVLVSLKHSCAPQLLGLRTLTIMTKNVLARTSLNSCELAKSTVKLIFAAVSRNLVVLAKPVNSPAKLTFATGSRNQAVPMNRQIGSYLIIHSPVGLE